MAPFKVYLALILCLAYVSLVRAIINGDNTNIFRANYTVSVHRSGAFICGGVLASLTQVISTANCTIGLTPDITTVRGGSVSRSAGGVTIGARRIINHPSYDANTMANDISVVKLLNILIGANIAPCRINLRAPPVGAALTVFGWGQITANSLASPINLREGRMNRVANSLCNARYGVQHASKICMTNASTWTCLRDSGGPIVSNGYVVGVVSLGAYCNAAVSPTTYTSITQTFVWLNQTFNDRS